jgi:ParB family chromosome partitioning protein
MTKKTIDLTDFKAQVIQKTSNKGALGRGIAALIGDMAEQNSVNNSSAHNQLSDNNLNDLNRSYISEINIDDCKRSRYQMRKNFDQEAIQVLSESIKVNGVLQPILVRDLGEGKYEIVAGERRLLASRVAGKRTIPAIILKLNDKAVMEIGIIENLQRQDLNPIEEANAYKALIFEFDYSHNEVSKIVGKSRSYITNYLRILNLPQEIKDFISKGKLKLSHAKVLTTAKNPIEVAKMVIKNDMSVIELEELLRQESAMRGDYSVSSGSKLLNKPTNINSADTEQVGKRLSEITSKFIKLNMKLKPTTASSGTLVIKYKDINQLKKFLDL